MVKWRTSGFLMLIAILMLVVLSLSALVQLGTSAEAFIARFVPASLRPPTFAPRPPGANRPEPGQGTPADIKQFPPVVRRPAHNPFAL